MWVNIILKNRNNNGERSKQAANTHSRGRGGCLRGGYSLTCPPFIVQQSYILRSHRSDVDGSPSSALQLLAFIFFSTQRRRMIKLLSSRPSGKLTSRGPNTETKNAAGRTAESQARTLTRRVNIDLKSALEPLRTCEEGSTLANPYVLPHRFHHVKSGGTQTSRDSKTK